MHSSATWRASKEGFVSKFERFRPRNPRLDIFPVEKFQFAEIQWGVKWVEAVTYTVGSYDMITIDIPFHEMRKYIGIIHDSLFVSFVEKCYDQILWTAKPCGFDSFYHISLNGIKCDKPKVKCLHPHSTHSTQCWLFFFVWKLHSKYTRMACRTTFVVLFLQRHVVWALWVFFPLSLSRARKTPQSDLNDTLM